ncbi:MAG: hypothetical protein EAZ07_01670 [Cytophagales bacterium]|nr:MAG: hypothetical protein EAZ07_01670 [Cytophagales bacterium]
MCTVSFYKGKDQAIITSNRDENINRPLALPPKKIFLEYSAVYCPIDPLHNGTWFTVSKKGNVLVLLNGAEKKHISNPPYKKSRGLVLLDIADSIDIIEKWRSVDLQLIENFTIVSYSDGKLIQFRWDGINKSQIALNEINPHIWSSTTLYDQDSIIRREEWFHDFLANKKNVVTGDDFFNFHTNTKNEDKKNGLIINRANQILTKNVTQTVIYQSHFTIEHRDLITNKCTIIADLIA